MIESNINSIEIELSAWARISDAGDSKSSQIFVLKSFCKSVGLLGCEMKPSSCLLRIEWIHIENLIYRQ